MSNQYADDLIGTSLGDFTLQELVGEGTFSHVFRGVDRNQSEKAIKVPRRFSNVKEDGVDFIPTQVFLKKARRFTPQEASPIHILRIQVARTKSVHDHGLVRVEDYSFAGDKTFSRMPLLLGRTLREYMRSGPVPISVIRNIALTLERLNRIDSFNYHGDVKPENMMVTANGVVMVDCGYFGNVQVADETIDKEKSLIVTTPRYYPLLKPDDLLALGLIVWEAACRKPLFNGVAYSGDFDTEHIAEDLVECVSREEALGNFNFTQVLGAEMPSSLRPGMPPRVETILLKGVRLKVTKGGVLTLDEGYDNFEHLADDLKKLTQEGIHYL